MRRRTVLASLAAVSTGGCLETLGTLSARSESGETGQSCPSFDTGADRTVCADDEQTDVPVSFQRSSRVLSPSEGAVETLTFALTNQSNRTFGFNPNDWEIQAWTTEGWRHIAPDVVFQPLYRLSPGERFRWELSLRPHPGSDDDATTKHVTESLDPARYAFSVSGGFGTIQSEESNGTESDEASERIEFVARFRVASE